MQLAHRRSIDPRVGPFPEAERGYTMVITALLLVPLLLMAGFSIDVGGWYNRTNDMQKAADAAALAGVVWLPDVAKAKTYALEAAARNGYVNGVDFITVTVAQTSDRRLRVTIKDARVESAIYQSLTGKTMTFNRQASAEYVLPVPLGSPEARIGNDPTSGYTPNLWASISGPYAGADNGDPYSAKCLGPATAVSCGTASPNPEFRTSGYIYVVDVPASAVGQTLSLSVYDAGNYARSSYPNIETADTGTVQTQFEFFRASATPLDTSDDLTAANSMSGQCSSGPGVITLADNASAATYKNQWVNLCTVVANRAGQWLLQVKSNNIPGLADTGNGWNQFSLKASLTGATQPALYTKGDLSLFNNLPGQVGTFSSTFYLAKIEALHAGKTLLVSLFDPGDGLSGTYYVNILKPGGVAASCTYEVRGGSSSSANPCKIQTRDSSGGNIYNGKWLDISIQLPNTYTCSTDCWWKVKYDFVGVLSGKSPNDRTVWAAKVIGDPVHLVEDGT